MGGSIWGVWSLRQKAFSTAIYSLLVTNLLLSGRWQVTLSGYQAVMYEEGSTSILVGCFV